MYMGLFHVFGEAIKYPTIKIDEKKCKTPIQTTLQMRYTINKVMQRHTHNIIHKRKWSSYIHYYINHKPSLCLCKRLSRPWRANKPHVFECCAVRMIIRK